MFGGRFTHCQVRVRKHPGGFIKTTSRICPCSGTDALTTVRWSSDRNRMSDTCKGDKIPAAPPPTKGVLCMSPEEIYPPAATRIFRGSFVLLIVLLCSQPIFPAITLDPKFGPGGKILVSFPDTTITYTAFGQRIFVQPSGRIIAGGMFTNSGPDGQTPGVAFVGLTPTGGVDTGYG